MGLDFNIRLSGGGNAIFSAGETIRGEVLITATGNKNHKLRGVKLAIVGYARVSWNEGTGRNKRTVASNKTYMDYKTTLTNKALKGKEVLPSGKHSFPFTYELPRTIPSTFEHKFGKVCYYMRATLDVPWEQDESQELSFIVINYAALKPQHSKPFIRERSKEFSAACCFCKLGSVYAKLKVHKTGILPGDTIPITVQVKLDGNVEVKEIKMLLVEKMVFHARNTTKKASNILATERMSTELKNDTKEFLLRLIPPTTPLVDMTSCGIITVTRQLEVTVVSSGMRGDLTFPPVPVVFGRVPEPSTAPATTVPVEKEKLNVAVEKDEKEKESPLYGLLEVAGDAILAAA